MRAEDRAFVLEALESFRTTVSACAGGLNKATSLVVDWQSGRKPSAIELSETRKALGKGVEAFATLPPMIDEIERLLVLEPTDTPLQDGPIEGASDDSTDAQHAARGFFDSLDVALTGAHSALGDVSTLLAALAQGQRLDANAYREKQSLVLELVQMFDDLRGNLNQLRGR